MVWSLSKISFKSSCLVNFCISAVLQVEDLIPQVDLAALDLEAHLEGIKF